MTPKNRAHQFLYDISNKEITVVTKKKNSDSSIPSGFLTHESSKEFAVILCNELIKNSLMCYENCFNHENWSGDYDLKEVSIMTDYWQQVKNEIIKL